MWTRALLIVFTVLVAGMAVTPSWAQDPKVNPTIARGKGEPEAKPPRKVRGRLPAYYSRVVSQEQREEIYAIQARFAAEMQKLKEQLEAMEQARDKEVSGVLTADQKKQVDAMVAAARAKRAARIGGDDPPAEPAEPAGGGS